MEEDIAELRQRDKYVNSFAPHRYQNPRSASASVWHDTERFPTQLVVNQSGITRKGFLHSWKYKKNSGNCIQKQN